jgi:LysR family transcriptional activator of dmlA
MRINSGDFAAYEALMAVVDSGSFGAAARYLGLAQSSVSRRIAQLETRLGLQLLARTTRTVKLTPAGHQLVESVRESLQKIADAETLVAGGEAGAAGLVRMTMPSAFGRAKVMPVIAALLAEFRDLSFDLDLSDQYTDLSSARIDLSVRFSNQAPSGWHVTELCQIRARLCAAPAYLAANGVPAHIDDLAAHRLIAAQTYAPRTRWKIARDGTPGSLDITPAALASDFAAVLELTRCSGGIAALPEFLAERPLADGELVELLPGSLLNHTAAYLLIPGHLELVPRVKAVKTALVEALGKTKAAS